MRIVLAYIFIFITNLGFSKSKKYDNYTLFNVVATERYQIKFLQNLETQKYIDAIFWRRPYKMFSDIQVLVNPMDLSIFKERLTHFSMNSRILSENIQR